MAMTTMEYVVCLEEMKEKEITRTLTYDHSFHLECADTWLPKHSMCPFCKVEIRHEDLY